MRGGQVALTGGRLLLPAKLACAVQPAFSMVVALFCGVSSICVGRKSVIKLHSFWLTNRRNIPTIINAAIKVPTTSETTQFRCSIGFDPAPFWAAPIPNPKRSLSSTEAAFSQEAGGNNSLWTGDASEWRCDSTNSLARATLEMKDATHAPATSIHLRPPKFRTQITLAVEPIQVAINSAQ